jgi:hypothetical protein
MTTIPRDRAAGWLAATALAAYILYATRDWDVPSPGGPDFGPLWVVGTVLGLVGMAALRRRIEAVTAIAVGALVAMALTDVSYLASQNLRDLHLYLNAGERFAAGEAVYLERVLTARPEDLTQYPYLYPPPTLPVFAALAAVPRPIVDATWVVGGVSAALTTLRLFGLSWRWSIAFLLWPPVFQGLQVGNVSVPMALLFAAGPWLGAGLVVAAVFKLYSGATGLWLVRERRLRPLVIGAALLAAWTLATLPLTGIDRWAEWARGLSLFQQSQPLLPDSLYGFGLPHFMPSALALVVGGLLVLAALAARGLDGLARLGLATTAVAPSLYAHGLIVALPAFLVLHPLAFWSAIAITSVAPGIGWWGAIVLGIAGWFVPPLRRGDAAADGPVHPLGGASGPWPDAPDTGPDQGRV